MNNLNTKDYVHCIQTSCREQNSISIQRIKKEELFSSSTFTIFVNHFRLLLLLQFISTICFSELVNALKSSRCSLHQKLKHRLNKNAIITCFYFLIQAVYTFVFEANYNQIERMSYGKTTLGYWGIRGRGQVARLLLAYTEAVWEDVKYTSPNQWYGADSESLGLDFPNMPYLIDGNVKMTESRAINIYIAERSNRKELLGKDLKDRAVVLNIEGVLNDILDALFKALGSQNVQSIKEASLEKIRPKIIQLAKFRGNKEWLLGYLTIVDFILAEITYYIQYVYPALFAKELFLQEQRVRFNSLPEIKKYYEQAESMKGPFLPSMANFKPSQ